jgi:hypothetical protein
MESFFSKYKQSIDLPFPLNGELLKKSFIPKEKRKSSPNHLKKFIKRFSASDYEK